MEALFASFLLLTSVLLSVQLFDSSLKAEAENEQRTVAAMVAENALEEIRAAATEDFEQLRADYQGRSWSLPEYPDFTIQSQVRAQTILAPCSELESQYTDPNAPFPKPRPREMTGSIWRVQLDITWSRAGSDAVTVVEYFSSLKPASNFTVRIEPAGPNTINGLTTGTFSVARNRTLDFSATARADGQTLDDIQFSWYVEPLDGFGSVYRVSRDGTECRYRNYYRNANNAPRHAPGKCDLVVRAVYQGSEAVRKVRIENL